MFNDITRVVDSIIPERFNSISTVSEHPIMPYWFNSISEVSKGPIIPYWFNRTTDSKSKKEELLLITYYKNTRNPLYVPFYAQNVLNFSRRI